MNQGSCPAGSENEGSVHVANMCIHTHIHIHIWIYRYTHLNRHAYIHTYIITDVCIWFSFLQLPCFLQLSCMYICIYVCMYVCMYACMRTVWSHECIHVCMHLCSYGYYMVSRLWELHEVIQDSARPYTPMSYYRSPFKPRISRRNLVTIWV